MKNERKNYVLPALSLIAVALDVMVVVGSGGVGENEQLSKDRPPAVYDADDSCPDYCEVWDE